MRLDEKAAVKRLLIYFFYDNDGIVDRYVPYLLSAMVPCVSELQIVVNGKLSDAGRETFAALTDRVLIRENIGFDVWAYKAALEQYGWEALSAFDEVILMNHTVMGPLHPFEDMFRTMDARDLDFWGLTMFHGAQENPFDIVYGYTPEHLQSHFLAIRKPMLTSEAFRSYWEKMPPVNSYIDSIGKHEAVFTKFFADAGFRWQSYVDTSDQAEFTNYPLMYAPVELIEKHGCPIFKRRSFFNAYSDLLANSNGRQGMELFRYLKEKSDFDVDMVWENMLRTVHMDDLQKCLHLNYVLPSDWAKPSRAEGRTALLLRITGEDRIEDLYRYACSMPETADLFLVGAPAVLAQLEEKFAAGPWNRVTSVPMESTEGAWLPRLLPLVRRYDLVCYAHGQQGRSFPTGVRAFDFADRCLQSVLATPAYTANIVDLFAGEPRLGLLCPPPPVTADFADLTGREWGTVYADASALARKLSLACPMGEDHEPLAPFGSVFWFRPRALEKLAEQTLAEETAERLYPFAAQDAGFYTAWCLPEEAMRAEWTNLAYSRRELTRDLDGYFRKALKQKIKKWIPRGLWERIRKAYRRTGGSKWIG